MDKSINIMLVDDDAEDRELFLDAAKEVEPTCTCVLMSNGKDALAYLKNEESSLPDFIFLDLRMPGLSGQSCLEEIKKDARLNPVPVIVYTTSADVGESIALKKAGAAHFMTKPTSPDDIYYMLAVVLGEKWGQKC